MTDPFRPDDPELTRRIDVPDPGTAEPAADATPTPTPTPAAEPLAPTIGRYSTTPEPRPAWSRHEEPMMAPTPERWYEPAPAIGTATVAPPTPTPTTGSRGGAGMIVASALLAAVLASGGTVIALQATGSLDQPTPVASSSTGQTVGSAQPVTIDESSATIDVAAKVNPAVVQITTSGDANTDLGIIPATGVGSGVIYDAAGWILTNRHVIEGSDTMKVELNDGRSFTGSVYGIDTLTDLAIVKIDGTDLPTAALGHSDALRVGQLVIAIGSPLGTYSNSVTSGIVSAKGRSITTDDGDNLNNLIQTDAAINPGNSGGPLLDANASVVGINTAIAADSNGIGFAIPIDIARPIMAQAVAGQKLARPYMGIVYRALDVQYAKENNLPVSAGALLIPGGPQNAPTPAVIPGGPAATAGFKEGDIIVKVNSQAIDVDHPLDATLSEFAPGDTISVEVLRGGQSQTLSVTLGTRPADL